ncbi:ATP-binding protein [Egicoccus halophilus]|nr:histidine kinase dimerization/phospho-acceptor domain-containing protein [Egicoccus halophilus]
MGEPGADRPPWPAGRALAGASLALGALVLGGGRFATRLARAERHRRSPGAGKTSEPTDGSASGTSASNVDDRDVLDVLVHELRTPISSIGSLTRALGDGDRLGPEERRQALELVALHTEHLAAMLDDVRDFSAGLRDRSVGPGAEPTRRAPTAPPHVLGPPVARAGPVALPELVLGAASACGIPAARLDVVGADTTVHSDAVRLRRIVTNLLENAARHGASDAPVAVSWALVGGELRLRVRSRVRSATGTTTAGAGLGIPIVDALAHSLGGRVEHRRSAGHHDAVLCLPSGEPTPPPPVGSP